MILLAAIALTVTGTHAHPPPHPHPTGPAVQATATIRVLSAVTLKLDGSRNPGAPPPRDCIVKVSDGSPQVINLIEFQ